ncbi:uracil phosphoribosyltransferase [Fodinibius roseus]|uniref:Uracil phosphoribosyltransferase n=1 Tax=Fodinibius roseus TaxID=1194090 RepID=A0A1M5CTH5_9BACT|nr:uracil phosphoribosyltransferase [Fodinibius roseus]SHF58029.1 uracil phosphoribosyltransferase [Fodinibius roseus]
MTSRPFERVTLIEHPVIARDLTILRDINTQTDDFRGALKRIAVILAYHALKELPLSTFPIETPVRETTGYDIDQDIIVVPILRAGLGLSDALLQFIPNAKVGHLGMYRDEQTHQPVDYYSNIPEGIEEAMVLVVDPMLATGGSADDALSYLKKEGAQHLRFISLISAPEGLQKLDENHPDVHTITAAIDEKLNDDAFIVPGLGDAGDRYFGTT